VGIASLGPPYDLLFVFLAEIVIHMTLMIWRHLMMSKYFPMDFGYL